MVEFVIWFFWFLIGIFPSLIIRLYIKKEITVRDLLISIFYSIYLGPFFTLITFLQLNPNTNYIIIKKEED